MAQLEKSYKGSKRKAIFLEPFERMNGKLAQQSVKCKVGKESETGVKFYYCYAKNNNVAKFGLRRKSRTSDYSAEELGMQSKFKNAVTAAAAILKDPEQRAQAVAEWQTNGKNFSSLYSYLIARELHKA